MDDNAVSSVVGTVLILAITVTTFTGLSLVVLDAVEEAQAAPRANIDIQQRGQQFVISHGGGDALDADQTTIVVYSQGIRTTYNLGAIDLDGLWGPGEIICIPCIHGDANGIEVIVRHGGSSVLASAGTTGAAGPDGGAVDLHIPVAHADLFVPGSPSKFRATVHNQGPEPAAAFAVRFSVDGTPLGATKTVPALASGESVVVESDAWTAVAGTHRIVILADPHAAVAESDESNNQKIATFVVSGGAGTRGFRDVDGDGDHTLGVDDPVLLGPLTAGECSGRPCQAGDVGVIVAGAGTAGLVVPATSDPMLAGERIYIEAPGNIAIAVPMTASGDDAVHVHSTSGSVTLTQAISTSKSPITVTAATGIVATGTHIEASGNGGQIFLTTASGDVQADGAHLVAKTIEVSAPSAPSGTIFQETLRLCVTWSANSGTCNKAHVAGSGPSEYAANVQSSTLIGTRAEGAWTA